MSRETKNRPTAALWYGPPGCGKTSLAAQVPGVVFLTDNTEQGIHTLKERGLVAKDIPVLPPAHDWSDVLGMVDALATGEHNYKALAIDAMGGIERLMHEAVCRRDFQGKWGNDGFASYQKGPEVSLADWRHFINALERLRDERGMTVIVLGHSKVKPFKNPSGPDYDRYIVDVHEKTWAMTCKWAEMVLFINFEVAFAKEDQGKAKAKASGGQVRIAYTENDAAYEAKNRHGLPAEIVLGNEGSAKAWAALTAALRTGKAGSA